MTGIPNTMLALRLVAPGNLALCEIPVPAPGPGEVLIQTKAACICTSDLHDIKSNPFGITYPRTLGHEGAGIIVGMGANVKGWQLGTAVAAHPVVPCGSCESCKKGLGHLCTCMGHLGVDRDGCFATFFTHRAGRVMALPADMSFSKGALLEPVAVCLQAIARAGDIANKTVLITGDGPFANIIARLLRRQQHVRLLVSGREPFRLQQMEPAEILASVEGGIADVAILAVSAAEAVQDCIRSLKPRGRLVVFSSLDKPVNVDLFTLHLRELEIMGACNDEDRMAEAMECLKDSSLNLAQVITHHIPFADYETAFQLAAERHDCALKVAITF
ncbi:zinc-dependent alcohol dehydrogenase [Foetidibacter luteolus]|uniref:zinc-dependent alcohol dehydrogenase n=1 Tax=Foetidibacter luteolus TaxID=2608880 RepID=UPI00129B2640|nr:alcohol dehydrogenase catalytic domain-containing protein [Foetidibacter luteolus]